MQNLYSSDAAITRPRTYRSPMLTQRLRRRASFTTTLGERRLFAAKLLALYFPKRETTPRGAGGM